MAKKTISLEKNIFVSYWECITKYCQLRGRTDRRDYWSFVLINFIIGVILGYMESIQGNPPVWSGAYSIFICLPSLAAQTRRLHDTNHSGWWLGGLLIFIVLAGIAQAFCDYNKITVTSAMANTTSVIILAWFLVLLFFYIKKGNDKSNKYDD